MYAAKAENVAAITVFQGESTHEIQFNREVRLTGGRFLWVRRREASRNGSKRSSGVPVAHGLPNGRSFGNR